MLPKAAWQGVCQGCTLTKMAKNRPRLLPKLSQKHPSKPSMPARWSAVWRQLSPWHAALGLEVAPSQGLIEVDFGKWQDKTLKQLRHRKLWKVVQANPSRMRFPGGETFTNAQQRIVQELETLAQEHDPKDLIACFSHSDLIKLAVSYYLGQPLDLFQRIMIAPASISTLHLGEMGAHIINVNHQCCQFVFF